MAKSVKYNHSNIENKWRKKWEAEGIYSPNIERAKEKFYNLWMFPYPSAEGLHAGHAFASTGSDVFGRYMRMLGKNTFQPIGYDSFGIHSENFAIKTGKHPADLIDKTTKNYERQMRELGHGYDWSRTVTTSDIDYYRWTQWIFVQLFKAGLAYRKKSAVNWCPSCKTVLADEQVIDGKCERCRNEVETKQLKQWFFRITDYADKLLENLGKIDWTEKIKIAQRNWIGKSSGARLRFKIAGSDKYIESFTTRPDTLYGATFFVLSPEHPQLADVAAVKYQEKVKVYIDKSRQKSREDRISDKGEKTGVFTGGYVINPANDKKITVYVADYVLMDYGTGAIMAVPAHDQRDWDFADKEKLPIVKVVSGPGVSKKAHDRVGELINSDGWNGIKVPDQIDKIIESVEKKGWGKRTTSYHLRDWLISRQRYWGPPIPMIFCRKCASEGKSWFSLKGNTFEGMIHKNQNDWDYAGWYPVSERELPVELPNIKDYKPKGTGRGPLADHPEFYKANCPGCGSEAKRETDVSDTFLDSSWYFLRYPSVGIQNSKFKIQNDKLKLKNSLKIENWKLEIPWNDDVTRQWLPVDLYFGGAEHAVLHLMYSRFVTMVLNDLKYIDFDEPFSKFYAHGLMIKDCAKMSKSRGNVVNPDEYIEKLGADTLRLYLMFMGPMDGYPDFRDTGIEGMRRFVERVWELCNGNLQGKDSQQIQIILHQTIKKVTEDIQKFHYNTAISAIMELVNLLREQKRVSKESIKILIQLLAPFTPHLSEEIWNETLGQKFSVHTSKWPKHDPKLVKEETVTIPVQINGKLRATIKLQAESSKKKEEVLEVAKEDEKVKKWIEGKKVVKEIFVEGKLINFVVK